MKKAVLVLVFLCAALCAFGQRLSTVGILPFEEAAGINPSDSASALRQVVSELSSWGTLTILEGDAARTAEYLVQGRMSRLNNGNLALSARTIETRTGNVLNESREQAANLETLSILSFCIQIVENVPYPNYLLGKWQSTITMSDGPLNCIIEFNSDRTVRVEQYDTWEHRQNNALKYEGYGSGTYGYAGYVRRILTRSDAQGNPQQSPVDATLRLSLRLQEALPGYNSLEQSGLRLLFNDDKSAFEILGAGLSCGRNYDGPGIYPSANVTFTRFNKIETRAVTIPPAGQSASPEDTPLVSAAPLWEKDLDDMVVGTPFLQAESAVLACQSGSIRSFFRTGTALWDFDPRDRVTPFVARSVEGSSYVCNTAGVFMAVNRVGRELWRLDLGKAIEFSPLVGWDGRVFIPVGSQLSCRTAAGHPLWSIDLESAPAAAPVLDHAGSVAVVLQNRDFVRISQFSAVERVSLDRVPAMIVSLKDMSAAWRHDYVLLYPSGEAEKITFNDRAPAGEKLARENFPSLPAAPIAAASRDDRFAVTVRDGRVIFFDQTGKVLWTGNSHETTAEKGRGTLAAGQASMVFDERGIYTISTQGAAGFAPNGRRRFIFKGIEAAGVPALSDEGIFYACGKDGLLRAYKLDSKPRTIPRSRYYGPDPEGSYGMGNPPPSPWAGDNFRYDDTQQDIMYEQIGQAIRSGQLGEAEPEYVAYLMEMIGFFLNDPHYSQVRPLVKAPQRVRLIRLLGQIGSRETVPFLWNIFDKDTEPAVRAACAEAIGDIGVDPTGRTFVSYNFLLTPTNQNTDPQLLISATSSIAALCRFSGPPLSADGIRLLRYFSNLPYPPNRVKVQIRNELDALRREGLDKVME
ncbi:MAG: PQQ-binding-like beta-propeller repeat protein [Spirochaetaceae bacterium]|jgi:outer membrane protein assembly factor BamB|nr:PQQ-binding-like beta-propeller repeat protein [Spirochaetaceae bacterium]